MTISDRSPSRTIRRTVPPCHRSPQPTLRRSNGLPTKTIAWILAVAMTASPAIFCSPPAWAQQQPILSSATQVIALDHDGSGGQQWHFNASTGASYNTTVTAAKLRTLIQCAYIYASENDDQFPPLASMLFDEAYWAGEGSPDPCTFYSAADSDPAPTTIDNDVLNGENSAQISFEYRGAGLGTGSGNEPVFVEIEDDYNGGMGKLVVSANGQITFCPSPFAPLDAFHLTLDACPEGEIHRGPVSTSEDYLLDLPPDTVMAITGPFHHLNMLHEGTISQSLLDLFDVEGWGTASNTIYYGDRYYAFFPHLTINNPSKSTFPVSFYSKFESVLTIPAAGRDAGATISFTVFWYDHEGNLDRIAQYGSVSISNFGVIEYENTHVVDVYLVQSGESDYVPGHITYRLRGVTLLTLDVPTNIDGYFVLIGSQTLSRKVRPDTPAGEFMRALTSIEHAADALAGNSSVNTIKAFVNSSYDWHQSLGEYPGVPIYPFVRGDIDKSNAVGLADASAFIAAFTGPNNDDLSNFEALQYFDLDGDGDIDCDDYDLFADIFELPQDMLPEIPECDQAHTITVHVEGEGNVRLRPHAGPYQSGERVWLIPEQWHNRRFVEWQGDLSGSAPVAEIIMNEDIDVTAVFEQSCGLNLEMSGSCPQPTSDPATSALVAMTETTHGPIRHAESFSYPQPTELQAVRWYGGYSAVNGGDCSNSDQGDNFIISIYDDDNGLPGDLLVSDDAPILVERSTTGVLREPPLLLEPIAEFRYAYLLNEPFVAAANKTYWVEIINDRSQSGDNPCLWHWAYAASGDGASLADYDENGYAPEDIQNADLTLCLMTLDQSNEDCDRNGLADDCELSTGIANDCNQNWVPDACEDVTPIFTQHPQSQMVDEGSPITFSVAVAGAIDSFRWQKNGQYITGANSSTYTIERVTTDDAGVYRAEVMTPCGNAFSHEATLTVQEGQSLNVSVQGGPGCAVTLDPPGGVYTYGQQVTLSAWPTEGWRFDRWEGDASGNNATTKLIIDSDKSVTAVFERLSYTLNLSISGNGDVDIFAVPEPQNGRYLHGAIVRLTAKPNLGWFFAGWSGGSLSGTASPLTIVMTSDRDITATFSLVAAPTYTLSATIVGQGQVLFDQAGGVYEAGETAELEAVPAEGWIFERWTGAIEGTDAQAQIVMNADHVVVAVFREAPSGDNGNEPESPGTDQTENPPASLPNLIEPGLCGECANGAAAATLSMLLLWMPARISLRRSRRRRN